MEYFLKGFSGGALGEPPLPSLHLDEVAIKKAAISTFTNCDYVATLTIKGAHKQRNLSNNFSAQYLLFIKIKDLINSYCQYYLIIYEIHKCSEWLHSHFIFRPKHRSKVPKMRKEIYELIEGHKLEKKSYRHRILIEKPYNYINYISYMFKDFDHMAYFNLEPHYKLISQPNICPQKIIKRNQNQDTLEEGTGQNPLIDHLYHVQFK